MKFKFILIGIVLLTVLVFIAKPYYLFLTKTLKVSIFKTLLSRDSLITFDDQVNILILGIPGGEHQGPNLSDTMIVANYNFKINQLTTISIPRDIWSDTLRDKINTAYAYGEAKQVGGGLKLAKAEISTIVGQPVRYAAVIDFSKFEELIDFLEGVEIEVERSFTDKKFPIAGKETDDCGGKDEEYQCRYEIISFTKGITTMDGQTALKFVRSRNAEGAEGSDFAREARQQKVIDAVTVKITQILKKADFKKMDAFYQRFDQLIDRDITNQQLAMIAKSIIIRKLFRKNLIRTSLTIDQEFFVVPPYYQYDGKYVLIPKDEDYAAIHQFLQRSLKQERKED